MNRRLWCGAVLALLACAPAARAQEQEQVPGPVLEYVEVKPERPSVLSSLYVSYATLQVLDLHSTYRAIDRRSGREANPVVRGVLGNRAATIALKAGATAVSIYAIERMWKVQRRRRAAVITAWVVDGVMTAVIVRNYRVGAAPAR